jgi:hypothetical protein
VWYKHRNNLFLPTYAETTSMALVRAVNTAVESILFTNIVYWMMGYTRTAGVSTRLDSSAPAFPSALIQNTYSDPDDCCQQCAAAAAPSVVQGPDTH